MDHAPVRPSDADDEPLRQPAGPLVAPPERPRMGTRWIYEPDPAGWSDFALSEWELTAAGWSDFHVHTETNVVLSGELYVECNGRTVIGRPGDTITVPAGRTGRYWTPTSARMLAIYGANPSGRAAAGGDYWEITPDEG